MILLLRFYVFNVSSNPKTWLTFSVYCCVHSSRTLRRISSSLLLKFSSPYGLRTSKVNW